MDDIEHEDTSSFERLMASIERLGAEQRAAFEGTSGMRKELKEDLYTKRSFKEEFQRYLNMMVVSVLSGVAVLLTFLYLILRITA